MATQGRGKDGPHQAGLLTTASGAAPGSIAATARAKRSTCVRSVNSWPVPLVMRVRGPFGCTIAAWLLDSRAGDGRLERATRARRFTPPAAVRSGPAVLWTASARSPGRLRRALLRSGRRDDQDRGLAAPEDLVGNASQDEPP